MKKQTLSVNTITRCHGTHLWRLTQTQIETLSFHGYVPASVVDKAAVATRYLASHQRQPQQRKQHQGKPATTSQQPINKTFNNESTTNTEKNNKRHLGKRKFRIVLSEQSRHSSVGRTPTWCHAARQQRHGSSPFQAPPMAAHRYVEENSVGVSTVGESKVCLMYASAKRE